MDTFVRIVEGGSLTAAAGCAATVAAFGGALAGRARGGGRRAAAQPHHAAPRAHGRGTRVLRARRSACSPRWRTPRRPVARRVEPRGRLRVTASVLFGRLHVAPLVHDFIAKHPAVRVGAAAARPSSTSSRRASTSACASARCPSRRSWPCRWARRGAWCARAPLPRSARPPASPEDLAGTAASASPAFRPDHEWVVRRRRTHAPREGRTPVVASNQIDVALEACLRRAGPRAVPLLPGEGGHARRAAARARARRRTSRPRAGAGHLSRHAAASANVRALVDWLAPRLKGARSPRDAAAAKRDSRPCARDSA